MEHLLEFCTTDRQREVIETVIRCGGTGSASRELGISQRNVQICIKRVRGHAAKNGVAPEASLTKRTAEGFATKRVSTNYDSDGEVKQQWHIQEPDKAVKLQALLDTLDSFEYKPAPVIPSKEHHNDELCTLYTLTDFHLGMYSYAAESGSKWDINIARNEAITGVASMIAGSPESKLGILNLQGDFMHWDGLDAVTPTAKHIVDADVRFSKLIDMSLDVIMEAVSLLLAKHELVKVIICEGNHDIVSTMWLRKTIKKIFRDNKRIEVDDSEVPYYAHLHGKIMIAMHHGHKKKNTQLPALFSSEPRYRAMWGAADYCYIHTGHYHHAEQDMAENGGAIVERHPTLAGRDAYAARGGYVSWRSARAITYHNKHGEIMRVTVTPQFS